MADTIDKDKIDPGNFIPTNEAFNIISFGVAAIKQTSDGVKNSFKARIQQKNIAKQDNKITAARLLNAKKKEDKEKLIEAAPKAVAEPVSKKIKKSAGSLWDKIMNAAAAVFTGWILDKLPQIMEGIQKAIEIIGPIVNAITTFFSGLVSGLSDFYGKYEEIIGKNQSAENLPKAEDINKQWDDLEGDLKGQADEVKTNLADTKDAIKKFAKDNADKNTADPDKSPIGKADEHLHSSTAEQPEGLDTSQHQKAMHPENYVEPDKADEEARKNFEKENPQEAQSPAKDAKEKPEIDYNDQSKVVSADLKAIDETKYDTSNIASSATITKTESDTPLIDTPPAIVQTDTSQSSEAVGDGIKAPKIVTPSGLGMDMYSRKIILNPDAARGWKKLLTEAAKDGIDLTKAVTSSYRSPDKQRELIAKEDGINVITPAPVHLSPHVQGWAVDLATNTPEWNWMKNNAHKFGWRWQGASDPVHFDYMKGASSNTHWMEKGRNDWMQGNMNTGEKISSISSKGQKTTIHIPLNTIIKPTPPREPEQPTVPNYGSRGSSILYALKTINRAYT